MALYVPPVREKKALLNDKNIVMIQMSKNRNHMLAEVEAALGIEGWTLFDRQNVYDRNLEINEHLTIEIWRSEMEFVATTRGCSSVSCGRNDFDEYAIPVALDKLSYFLEILNYCIYYHHTIGPIFPAKVYEIGASMTNNGPFTHISAVLPYFLPALEYPLADKENRLYFSLIVPLFADDARWIDERKGYGLDAAINKKRITDLINFNRDFLFN